MKKIVKIITVLSILFMACLPVVLFGQPEIEDENVLDNPVPFDGGVAMLVAAAIAYGSKKAQPRKKTGTI